jgi:UDP-N-acetylglucosamine diphosphorylase/glucosamine-1-phosphate N-acetyltransferase
MVKDFSNLTNYAYKSKERIEGLRQLEHPFEIPQINESIIRSDFILSTKNRRTKSISPTNEIIKGEDIFVEEGAVIEHSVLNASTGPIYIGKDAVIMEGCLIRGPFVMNEGAVLKMGTKVYGATTLGPFCTAGGEIKNVVMQGYSNKAHDGYLGDSVIGEWCNFGAGTTNSNVKNTGGNVKVFDELSGNWVNAGNKCGVIAGAYTRTAINTSINTGSIIGVCCNVFGEGLLPRYIPNFCWGGKEAASYEFDKAIKDIENWKKMKHQSLNKKETEVLKYIFEQSIK